MNKTVINVKNISFKEIIDNVEETRWMCFATQMNNINESNLLKKVIDNIVEIEDAWSFILEDAKENELKLYNSSSELGIGFNVVEYKLPKNNDDLGEYFVDDKKELIEFTKYIYKYLASKEAFSNDEYIIFRDAFLLGYRCNCTDKNDLIPDIILDAYGSKIHKLQ